MLGEDYREGHLVFAANAMRYDELEKEKKKAKSAQKEKRMTGQEDRPSLLGRLRINQQIIAEQEEEKGISRRIQCRQTKERELRSILDSVDALIHAPALDEQARARRQTDQSL